MKARKHSGLHPLKATPEQKVTRVIKAIRETKETPAGYRMEELQVMS